MKKLIALFCFGVVISAPVFAGAQQEKMKGCSIEAKGMKGDERRAFMSKCLKKDYVLKAAAKPASGVAAAATQQDKMKSCNAEAKTKALKGDERRAFMKDCLKK